MGVIVARAPASVRRPDVPALPVRRAGHSAAKWPTPPQYMQRPCVRRCWRSAGVSFYLAADKSIGPAAVPVAVPVAVMVVMPVAVPAEAGVGVLGACGWC